MAVHSTGKKIIIIIASILLIAGLAVGGYVVYQQYIDQPSTPEPEQVAQPDNQEVIEVESETNLEEITSFGDELRPDEPVEFVPDPADTDTSQ